MPKHFRRALLTLSVLTLAALLTACGTPGTIQTGGSLPSAATLAPTPTPPPIKFPQDEAPHQDLTEWWYYTGHLQGKTAQGATHTYGFELTFFQTLRGQYPPYYAAHFAISDLTAGQFYYDQREAFAQPGSIPAPGATSGFNLSLGGWTMRGLNGHDVLTGTMNGYSFQLALTDELPHAILHNGVGIISYGAAGYSYYYSRPLMAARGTLTDHGTALQVTGQAWMDHQWGNFVSVTDSGWDWFSIQLANHTEYMLYILLDAKKQPVAAFGTAVAADGSASELAPTSIQIRATGSWTSPVTQGVYPSGWLVTLPGATLTLTPLLKDQELVTAQSTGVAYWEGAVTISGQQASKPVSGVGYVELTGYASIPANLQVAGVP
jgi:predicted secreted hydrolase